MLLAYLHKQSKQLILAVRSGALSHRKNMEMLEMIIQQSSRPGSLIMDCFCGSGAFLAAGIKQGCQVIGVDSSETAINTAVGRPELAVVKLVEF